MSVRMSKKMILYGLFLSIAYEPVFGIDYDRPIYYQLPKGTISATDIKECNHLAEEWNRTSSEIIQMHASCLASSSGSKPGAHCSKQNCEVLHMLMQELNSSGVLETKRKLQLDRCKRQVDHNLESKSHFQSIGTQSTIRMWQITADLKGRMKAVESADNDNTKLYG